MKLRIRLFAVAALLALLGVPGLSCFVPQQLLGADEKECCRLMGSQCGSKDMSVGSSRVDLQACKLEYSIVSPK